MKRTVSLVLLIALVFSIALLSGCAKDKAEPAKPAEPTAAPAEAPAEAEPSEEPEPEPEAPVNDIQARLDAGETVTIGYAVNTMSNPFLKMTVDYIVEQFDALKVTTTIMAAENSVETMISQIENFIQMKVDMIICAPMDQAAVEGICLQAMDAGIPVVFNGQHPAYAEKLAGGAAVDYTELGVQVASMGSMWIDQTYPDAKEGDIHTAVFGFNNTFVLKQVFDGIISKSSEDPRINVVYEAKACNNIDLGYTAAEEAMTMDPGILLFLSFQEAPGIGANNYLLSRPDIDISKMALFSGSYSDTSAELLEASKTNQSVLRGACSYGTYGNTGDIFMAEGLFQVCKGVLFGTVETPFWIMDDIWTLDTIGYNKLIDNPENDFLLEIAKQGASGSAT
ncbi:MAG: substrate-binding domain-containing protein [Oscillospiraceae bacterium]|jgi:ABC-type sugar transport system substrate-binding protein